MIINEQYTTEDLFNEKSLYTTKTGFNSVMIKFHYAGAQGIRRTDTSWEVFFSNPSIRYPIECVHLTCEDAIKAAEKMLSGFRS